MFLSVFDMFKIGIGPSSSHTVGPMVAARRFLAEDVAPLSGAVRRVTVSLRGSLAFTGKGHGTDRAVALGLAGQSPDFVDPDRIAVIVAALADEKTLAMNGHPEIGFDPATDLTFDYGPALPGHANGMIFRALDAEGRSLAERTFYSVGGGFVMSAEELSQAASDRGGAGEGAGVPYPFKTAAEMLSMGEASGLTIAGDEASERARAAIPGSISTRRSTASGRRWNPAWTAASTCRGRCQAASR